MPQPERPKTLQELYCEARRCTPAEFKREVFWKCLHRRAVPIAPLILLLKSDYFAPDREFIADAGRATDMAQVRRDVKEFFHHPLNANWIRRSASIRVSAGRLIRLAAKLLPPSPLEPKDSSGTYSQS